QHKDSDTLLRGKSMALSLPCISSGKPLVSFVFGSLLTVLGSSVLSTLAVAQSSKAPEVIVQAVSKAQLTTTIEALGNLRANESITLTSSETKKITRINFDDG